MNREMLLKELHQKDIFDRTELLNTIRMQQKGYSNNSLSWLLQELINDGKIVRVGRNQYKVINNEKRKKIRLSTLGIRAITQCH